VRHLPPPPYYTDNLMHNLKVERFFKPQTMINGRKASRRDGPIKTFPLRGIKDSPPYLHDGRLLTLEDTVEFFNLVLPVPRAAVARVALCPVPKLSSAQAEGFTVIALRSIVDHDQEIRRQ
jgi:hypothetical protein